MIEFFHMYSLNSVLLFVFSPKLSQEILNLELTYLSRKLDVFCKRNIFASDVAFIILARGTSGVVCYIK